MKVLYFANVAAEYRIPFFNELNNKVNIEFVITKQSINNKVYNFGKGVEINGKFTFLCNNKLKHYIELIFILIKREYDICVVPPLDSFSEMIDAMLITLLAKIRNKKIIYFWEKWQPDEKYIPFKKSIKNKLQKCAYKVIDSAIDMVLVPGKKSYEYFTQYLNCNSDKVKYVINSSIISEKKDFVNVRAKYKIDKSKVVILYFGRIVRFKGLDILIKAVSQLNDEQITLLICGDGDYKPYCEEMAKRLGVKNIIFTGKIESKERYNYFRESDLFILPSRIDNGGIEAWGLTVNEAMEMKIPCIVSDSVGCANEIILNDENGFIFKSEDSEDLSEKIKQIINDNDLKELIIQNAVDTVEHIYNYKNMSDSFIDKFKSLVEGV